MKLMIMTQISPIIRLLNIPYPFSSMIIKKNLNLLFVNDFAIGLLFYTQKPAIR